MRFLLISMLVLGTPAVVAAQTASPQSPILRNDDWHVTLTIFRSPGTGIQVSKGHLAAFIGHYPTGFRRDGAVHGFQFIRMGAAYYASPASVNSAYASLSFAKSLTDGWDNSGLLDIGMRHMFNDRYSGQFGAAALRAHPSGETRVNPTAGFGVRF